MPTNFPTSVDNFTNPTANDSLNLPSHSTQHANANDAIEAIETFLLPNGAGNSGLIKVIPTGATNATVQTNGDVTIGSAVSSVVVSGCFTTAYDNYKVIISGGAGSTANIILRLQLGSVNTGYYSNFIYAPYAVGSVASVANNNGANFNYAGNADSVSINANMEITSPFITEQKMFTATYYDTASTGRTQGILSSTTSITGFTILTSTGTLTGGTIRVYGYK